MDLSILIPARNEEWLSKTIDDVLIHCQGDTEVIAVLDGAWANPPIPDHPRVRLVYRPEAIGQRAATNLAARMSTATYLMKLDAHCSLDDGFDVKLMQADKEIGRPDVTQIPAQFNLHVFSWKCQGCGTETYQGPTPTLCATCGAKGTPGGPFERVVYWDLNAGGVPGRPMRTEFWRFDHDIHFQYWNSTRAADGSRVPGYHHRPEAKKELAEVMSSIGACFFMRRSRFEEIGGLDEAAGSWGNYGVEIACKSWLSGGLHIVNRRTWYAHLFRTQGGDFSFPYHNPGSAVERARQYSRDLWLNNKWPKQVRPLSWLIEHFAPIPGWHDPDGATRLAEVMRAGAKFARLRATAAAQTVSVANPANTTRDAGERGNLQRVSVDAMTLGAPVGRDGVGAGQIDGVRNEREMGGIATRGIVAHDVVKFGDVGNAASSHRDRSHQPCEHQAGQAEDAVFVSRNGGQPCQRDLAVAVVVPATVPDPAPRVLIDGDVSEQAGDRRSVEMGDREKLSISHAVPPLQVPSRLGVGGVSASSTLPILSNSLNNSADSEAKRVGSGLGAAADSGSAPAVQTGISKGLAYYSDCRGDPAILDAVREQIRRCANGHRIVSVTLRPVDFGENIVLNLERGQMTMFRQILTGLEALDTDFAYLTEHDVLYSPQHLQFTPLSREKFFYNQHRWQLSAIDGRAVHYRCCQTSGLCADRKLLIEHYKKRMAAIDAAGGYQRNMGYEPGTNKWSLSIDPHGHETFWTEIPNLDIRHGRNLSKTRWDPSLFRNKNSCAGWTEADEIPGWGKTKGRFAEWLCELHEKATVSV